MVEDYRSWIPKLSDRAIVLFHDTRVRERNFGVWRLWSEIASTGPSTVPRTGRPAPRCRTCTTVAVRARE